MRADYSAGVTAQARAGEKDVPDIFFFFFLIQSTTKAHEVSSILATSMVYSY